MNNHIIRVDRVGELMYPSFGRPLYADLERTGPEEISMTRVEQWFHPKQSVDFTSCEEVHETLMAAGLLDGCFGLRELRAIQAKPGCFFRRHFSGKMVFGWCGVVRATFGRGLSVPYLLVDSVDTVHLRWYPFEYYYGQGRDTDPKNYLGPYNPALRRAS